MKNRPHHRASRAGYTLIEVLAAAAVTAIGMSAAISLTSALMLQEELAHRVAITRNYQENMARVWQLGLSAFGTGGQASVASVMPTVNDSPMLSDAVTGVPTIIETGTVNPSGLGAMQAAVVTASVNVSQNPRVKIQGNSLTLNVYRPKALTDLRASSSR
ncbi:MAG TPA: hypothetical protein DIT64_20165 [Verrucomicrobiales bacterium]|nr:hypothetical protein [Verrucomicrobiales bacterium]HCN77710.1 hypothetical protein [Verrucomicrobiales bacterium]HRJ10464.1 prepilin-type N-terminal cleavage/methylation domain-containing protein [Prosthecobacter sp.]HRK15400.1 prepilin-type N-terminal cleavage/methylation domain-containing protein [Prosthecobacter sp.]